MPFNATAIAAALDALDESVTQVTHVGVHTLTDPGTGTTANAGEATGGSPAYARVAVTWGAAGSNVKTNSGALTWDVPAGTYGMFTLWNASTGNTTNFRGWLPFTGNPAAASRGFGTCIAADVTANTITSPAHGMANTDRVMVFNLFGAALPTGLTEGTIYFVVGATTDTFQVALTSGGSAVDITAAGTLHFQEIIPEVFAGQGQITAAIGALVLDGTTI
jgi:hypothetical protein